MSDLKYLSKLAKAIGGTLVVAAREVLTSEQESWLEEAGFATWTRSNTETKCVKLWPEHQNIALAFEQSSRGDLIWTIKIFGKEGDLFGKTARVIKPANAVRELTRIRLEIEKLDIMLMRVNRL
jgi:hypothetical protein